MFADKFLFEFVDFRLDTLDLGDVDIFLGNLGVRVIDLLRQVVELLLCIVRELVGLCLCITYDGFLSVVDAQELLTIGFCSLRDVRLFYV